MKYIQSAWYEISIEGKYITEFKRLIGTTTGYEYTSDADRRIVKEVCYIPFVYEGCKTEVINATTYGK